jgi:hypothetical protein
MSMRSLSATGAYLMVKSKHENHKFTEFDEMIDQLKLRETEIIKIFLLHGLVRPNQIMIEYGEHYFFCPDNNGDAKCNNQTYLFV